MQGLMSSRLRVPASFTWLLCARHQRHVYTRLKHVEFGPDLHKDGTASVAWPHQLGWWGITVDLKPGHPQTSHAVGVDRLLPCSELFDGEFVAATGFIEADRPIPDGIDDHGFASSDPAFRIRRRQFAEQRVDPPRDFIFSRIVKCRVPVHVRQNKPEALKEPLSETST